MPEHIKALAVILLLATVVFTFARRPVCVAAIANDDFVRRRNLWIGVTLLAFLSHNYWIHILLIGGLIFWAAPRESNKVALFFFLLFALPRIQVEVPGFGSIRYFFMIDYFRLVAIVLLLPAAIVLHRQAVADKQRPSTADKLLAAYIVLNVVLQFGVNTLTGSMRGVFIAFTDIVLPYYVVSRSLRDLRGFRDALASLSVGMLIMAAVGVFEFARHWLLYGQLDDILGVAAGAGNYLDRGDNLRAIASAQHPIVLGYLLAIGFGVFLYLRRSIASKTIWLLGIALLVAGELAPQSRGPWIGAATVLLVYLALGDKAGARLGALVFVGLVASPLLFTTTLGEKLIDLLPFVGTVESGNITYRQRLLEIALEIISASPVFGTPDFLIYMEELRQGQGIIDIVNSYVIIALNSGLVGLGLFVSFFGVILVGILRRMHGMAKTDEAHELGQALIAVTVGILVMIFTVSPISYIPVVYWAFAGVGLAYLHSFELVRKS